MTRTRWIIFALVCIAIIGGLVATKKHNDVNVSGVNPDKIVTKGKIPDHVFGSKTGKVTLIEYGDFQCPYCGELYPNLTPIREKYKDQVSFVFRDFPLTNLHPNALAAAGAAEAAGLQGKFWQMHDKLYENQDNWSNDNTDQRTAQFKDYAKQLGLNVSKFAKDLNSSAVSYKINFDHALGGKAGVQSTPTLILNGKTIGDESGAAVQGNAKPLEKALVKAIKASGQKLPPTNTDKKS